MSALALRGDERLSLSGEAQRRRAAPLHQKEQVEVVQACVKDASSRCFKTCASQMVCKHTHPSPLPPGRALGGSWGKESLGSCVYTAAPVTSTHVSNRKWMDLTYAGGFKEHTKNPSL